MPQTFRVLIVDDEAPVRKALSRTFRREGYEVLLADGPEEALETLEAQELDLILADHKMPGMTGVELLRNVFEPTCNIQGVTTGYQGAGIKTVIPSTATAKLDFRLVPDQDPEDVFEKLRSHLDGQGFTDVKATWLGAMWPERVSPDDPFVELTAQTGEAVYGKPARLVPLTGGSSPVYAFARPLGNIPVVTCGVGYWDNRVHAPNEHVRLDDFLNASRHVARILNGFAGI